MLISYRKLERGEGIYVGEAQAGNLVIIKTVAYPHHANQARSSSSK